VGISIDEYQSMTRREVESTSQLASSEVIAWAIVEGGAFHIRDVASGEEAYHYSSGNFGPGYVLVKGSVGREKLFKFLVRQLALRLADYRSFEFIAGLVTGGVVPAYELREQLQDLQDREIPYVYIRDTRKEGGTREHVTGIQDLASGGTNPEIPEGSTGVVMEELTNFANSISNGARVLRTSGYRCDERSRKRPG
jgi:orotate phosphoribosyltransferase